MINPIFAPLHSINEIMQLLLSIRKSVLIPFGYITSEWKLIVNEYDDTKELYNLKNDSLEENNLINTGLEIESNLWEEFLNNQKKAIY